MNFAHIVLIVDTSLSNSHALSGFRYVGFTCLSSLDVYSAIL